MAFRLGEASEGAISADSRIMRSVPMDGPPPSNAKTLVLWTDRVCDLRRWNQHTGRRQGWEEMRRQVSRATAHMLDGVTIRTNAAFVNCRYALVMSDDVLI